MKVFLKKCNDKTLFLIDEFGTGSDPLKSVLPWGLPNRQGRRFSFGRISALDEPKSDTEHSVHRKKSDRNFQDSWSEF